jgi:Glycosyl transferase family 2
MSQRLVTAIARRIWGPYRSLGRLDARLHDVQSRLERIERTLADIGETRAAVNETRAAVDETRNLAMGTHELLSGEIRGAVRAILAEEPSNRRRLHRLREDDQYLAAWTEARPLVTVTVATRGRAELLATRSLPSILAQTYTELELIVVGDHADDATAEAVRSLDDPRVKYRNLTQRLQFTQDPYRQWLVGATMARNEANRLAQGRWIVCFDDDDAMRPDCIERLLAHAIEVRLEAVYGRSLVRREGEPEFAIGSFPPARGEFTWASGMYHAGLRFLERELFAADLGIPGDWYLAERMLRAGVRFGMLDAILCDVYPSPMNQVRPSADG